MYFSIQVIRGFSQNPQHVDDWMCSRMWTSGCTLGLELWSIPWKADQCSELMCMAWASAPLWWIVMDHVTSSGWWFGTWLVFFQLLLRIIPIDELIFFRGVAKNHQPIIQPGQGVEWFVQRTKPSSKREDWPQRKTTYTATAAALKLDPAAPGWAPWHRNKRASTVTWALPHCQSRGRWKWRYSR